MKKAIIWTIAIVVAVVLILWARSDGDDTQAPGASVSPTASRTATVSPTVSPTATVSVSPTASPSPNPDGSISLEGELQASDNANLGNLLLISGNNRIYIRTA